MEMEVFTDSRQGLDHKENEDSLLVDKIKKLYALADGATRPEGGKKASTKALIYLEEFFDGDLKAAMEKSNDRLIEDRKRPDIGYTTLTTVAVKGRNIEVANVGDSPAYLIRNGKIRMLTVEDRFMGSGSLTQALGQSDINIHFTKEEIEAGDYIIMVSDGVTNVLTEDEILAIAKKHKFVEEIGKFILEAAVEEQQYYNDDKTIIVLHVSG